MRAAVHQRYGPPSVLESSRIGIPQPGPGDVLVQVGAAAVHIGDYFVLTGEPYVLRLAFGLRRPGRPVLGQQVAGEVVAVGADVSGYAVGDRVFGTADGSFAEYAVAKVSKVAATPEYKTFLKEQFADPDSFVDASKASAYLKEQLDDMKQASPTN